MRKIIVYIATSADGYIARPDGGIEWLDRPSAAGDYGMAAFYRTIDTILWGRKTYDLAIEFEKRGVEGGGFDPKRKHFVFSHQPPESPHPAVRFVTEPIPGFVRKLRSQPGKNIWMMGGAGIIGSFLDACQLDEFIIHVIPIFIGEGIPLIAPRHLSLPLKLLSSKSYSDGVVQLHYRVGAEPSPRKSRRSAKK